MQRLFLHYLCFGILVSRNLLNCAATEDDEPRRTYPIRRAIDGTRGRKFYAAEDLGPFDSDGFDDSQYESYDDEPDFTDLRKNVPGEPGVDYPSYTRVPQTGFLCETQFRGYYADEAAGCQVFHVCDGSFLVSSFLCPVGSIFSQKLLTCDWWSKVDCSATRNYHVINHVSHVSEVDDDEILRKAFEMASVRPAGDRIPGDNNQQYEKQQEQQERRNRVLNYGGRAVTERTNDLPSGPDSYSDYPDYPSRIGSTYNSANNQPNRQIFRNDDYYSPNVDKVNKQGNNPLIRVHTIGEDRKNDRPESYKNEFQPSYAPTVPTVTTTTRRFYSPTIPTTYRPSTAGDSPKFDLEVEGSDHLYTARGRSEDTIKAATQPSVLRDAIADQKNETISDLLNISSEQNDEEEREDANEKEVKTSEETETTDQQIVTAIPAIQSNLSESESSTEIEDDPTFVQHVKEETRNITETLSILTIDNENRDPNVFSYRENEEEETDTSRTTIVQSSTEIPEIVNSTNISAGLNDDGQLAEFLEPPQNVVSQFRITVLEDPSTTVARNAEQFTSQNTFNDNSSTLGSSSEILDVPASHITPPLPNFENEDKRESRIFRIYVSNDTNNNSSEDLHSLPNSVQSEEDVVEAKINSGETSVKIEVEVDQKNSSSVSPTTFEESVSTSAPVQSSDATPNSISNIEVIRSILLEPVVVPNESGSSVSSTTFAPSDYPSSTISQTTIVESHEESNESEETLLKKGSYITDSVVGDSSPVQVTLTVNKNEEIDPNGDVIRRLIAQHNIDDSIRAADYRNFEIVKSQQPDELSSDDADRVIDLNNEDASNSRNNRKIKEDGKLNEENPNSYHSNNFHSINYLRNIVALVNGPDLPRPFSLGTQNVEITNPSDLGNSGLSTTLPLVSEPYRSDLVSVSTRNPVLENQRSFGSSTESADLANSEKSASQSSASESIVKLRDVEEDSKHLTQDLSESKLASKSQKIVFDLPVPERTLDFETGLPLSDRVSLSSSLSSSAPIIQIEDSKISDNPEKATEKLHSKTVVETEFIPSLGFSLNTDEEREKYMDAVVKGLLSDVQATQSTINNSTNESIES